VTGRDDHTIVPTTVDGSADTNNSSISGRNDALRTERNANTVADANISDMDDTVVMDMNANDAVNANTDMN